MSDTTWEMLRELLASRYDELRLQLARRLGSEELAQDSLHDTWLRLNRPGSLGPVKNPSAYLLRIAQNMAADRRRREGRYPVQDEDVLSTLADPAPGPDRQVADRERLRRLDEAVQTLPPRRRAIFIASRLQETPHQEIARRFGISVRMVQLELKSALEHCAAALVADEERKE
ncbi:RNA polymerase sigma factor [Tepidicaulis sp. LMO-SS28]|uniref:RNA polymerase sigma factor n=1 Tax=Tepidicaulis sp. LMO-SS28 TaxID=3447455 RepID=UPI003EE05D14